MSELRKRFQRLSERAPSAPDAFERLERARRHRERNRRIVAGTVALLVAIAGSIAAFTAFRDSEGRVAGPVVVPDLANVICDGSSIAVDTTVVAARRDGVHINLSTIGETPIVFSVEEDAIDPGSSTSVSSPGRGAGDPNAEVVLQSGPGRHMLICDGSPQDGSNDPARVVASLDVVDPEGHFVTSELECAGGQAYGMAPAYAPGAIGDRGDPVEIVMRRSTGLKVGDVVERAGYPEGTTPIVRVVRDGAVIGRADLFDDGQGGWLLSSLEACGTEGELGWSSVGPDDSDGPMASSGPTSAGDALCASARAEGGEDIRDAADLRIEGRDLDFDTSCLIVPAREPLRILFRNLHAGVHMNISIYELTPHLRECLVTGTAPSVKLDRPIFRGEIILGVDEIGYRVGALKPGEYYFQDDVHPFANGVLIVE